MSTYNLQVIQVKNKHFVSLRTDLRTAQEVHNDGISGYNAGHRAPIYVALFNANLSDVSVINVQTNLPKYKGLKIKGSMVEAFNIAGTGLNVKNVA